MLFYYNSIVNLALLAASSLLAVARAHDVDHIELTKIAKQMPFSVSDFTATYFDGSIEGSANEDKDSRSILLIGGCSAELGNIFIDDSDFPGYYCTEFTNKVTAFFPETRTFKSLPDMPAARTRHTAVSIDKKIYIIGGRDENDALIQDVIVFDPETQKWDAFISLDNEHAASDHGSVERDGKIYVFGGWPADYSAARSNTYSIDTRNEGKIEELAPMFTERGDVAAVRYNQKSKDIAFVIGGFTDANNFCAPLNTVENYDFKNDKWYQSSSENMDLATERGDKVADVMDGLVLVIGGEAKHEDMCNETLSADLNPHIHAQGIHDIEVLDPLEKNAHWEKATNLPEIRFRAASAVDEKSNTLYLFGGQKSHNPTCNCYRTSDDIFSYVGEQPKKSGGLGATGIALIVTACALVLVGAIFVIRRRKAGKASGIEMAM